MPPKEKNSPERLVIEKLQEKNRPFSSITLGDELHNEVKQTQLKKILDQLSNDGVISCKISGKAKLYFAKQDDLQVATPEQLDQYDEKIDSLRDKANDLSSRIDELRARRDKLIRMKLMDELRNYRIYIEQQVQVEKDKKDNLIKMAEGITPEDAAKSLQDFNQKCDQWRLRKKKCKEIIDQLSEALDKKPSVVFEELELESDESQNLKLEYKDKKYTIIEDNVL